MERAKTKLDDISKIRDVVLFLDGFSYLAIVKSSSSGFRLEWSEEEIGLNWIDGNSQPPMTYRAFRKTQVLSEIMGKFGIEEIECRFLTGGNNG